MIGRAAHVPRTLLPSLCCPTNTLHIVIVAMITIVAHRLKEPRGAMKDLLKLYAEDRRNSTNQRQFYEYCFQFYVINCGHGVSVSTVLFPNPEGKLATCAG